MGATEVAGSVVEGLKNSPTALTMIAINVIWLAAAGWFISEINDRAKARDVILTDLIKQRACP